MVANGDKIHFYIFYDAFIANFLWDLGISFCIAAIDNVRTTNYTEVVTMLSKRLIQSVMKESDDTIDRLKTTILELESEIVKLKSNNLELEKSSNRALKMENAQLKSFLLTSKEKSTNPKLVSMTDYEEGKVINYSASSAVKEVYKTEKYAKKELKQSDHRSFRRFLNESEVLIKIWHPCIIRFFGFDYGDSAHPPAICLAFEPSSLSQAIEPHDLNNKEKNRITVEIALGMRYIHSNNLMHRNLKPNNILLSNNNHVRISDLGLTKEEDPELFQSKGIGSPEFMAPELFDDEDELEEPYTSKVDVYSFGVILLYIVTNQHPKVRKKNLWEDIPPNVIATVVPWAADLIHQCVALSPSDRPTFNEIFEILTLRNFDLLTYTNPIRLTSQQRSWKKEIESRILKIEAFEYQHRLTPS